MWKKINHKLEANYPFYVNNFLLVESIMCLRMQILKLLMNVNKNIVKYETIELIFYLSLLNLFLI